MDALQSHPSSKNGQIGDILDDEKTDLKWFAPVGLGLVVGGGFWLGHHLMADTGRTQVDFPRERVHWSESAMIGLSAFALTSLAGYTYMFITDDD